MAESQQNPITVNDFKFITLKARLNFVQKRFPDALPNWHRAAAHLLKKIEEGGHLSFKETQAFSSHLVKSAEVMRTNLDSQCKLRRKTLKLFSFVEAVLPRHLREPIMGDLYEDVVDWKCQGMSEKFIRRYLVWQLFCALVARVPRSMKIIFWGLWIAKLKRWIVG